MAGVLSILGVDPGSRVCGYGVLEVAGEDDFRYLECGVFEPNPKAPLEERLASIGHLRSSTARTRSR